ncbi:MAG: hypothetical protein IKZ90_00740 [Clostridiales bacterium]|nr:hypothetical protein [Clostridiales bacterium]
MNVSNSIDEKKRNPGELLFFALFIPWIAFCFLCESTFAYKYFTDLGALYELVKIILPMLIVSVKVLLLDKTDLLKKLALFSILALATAQCFTVTYSDDLILCVILVVGAFGIDFKKILKVYLFETLLLVAFTTIAAITGLIPHIISHQRGVTRYSLGAIWCTDYAARIFFLILVALYLYSAKMKLYHWIGILAAACVVFKFTFGKLDFACMVLAIAIFFLHELIEKKDKKNKCRSFWDSMWEKLAPFFTPVAAAIMTVLTLLYSSDSRLFIKLNDIFSNRFILGHRAFSEIGVTIFGQKVQWIGMGGVTNDVAPKGYNFVDCSYLNILFTFGILIAIAVIALHSYMAYKHRKDLRFVIVIAIISLNCIVAHHFIEVAYNPFWAAFLAAPFCSFKSPIESESDKVGVKEESDE